MILLTISITIIVILCLLYLYNYGQKQNQRAEHWKSVAQRPMNYLNEGRLNDGGTWGMDWDDGDDRETDNE